MTRRVALINNGKQYAGPALAREYARRGHDIVFAMPEDGLVEELEAMGAAVEVVPGKIDISDPGDAQSGKNNPWPHAPLPWPWRPGPRDFRPPPCNADTAF